MGKWSCKCGQLMDDHSYPDKNCYKVYSEVEWEDISSELEKTNGDFGNIPPATFDVYKCPTCGRLMVFSEGDRFRFYKLED